MASIGGSDVVKSGLVLSLDAANARSYVSGSATWRDLSGNSKNGTLQGSLNYDSSYNGNLIFDGTSSIVNLGTGNTFFPLPQISIESWFKTPGMGPNQTLGGLVSITYGFTLYILPTGVPGTQINFNSQTGSVINLRATNYNVLDNKWHQILVTEDGNTAQIYIDGALAASASVPWSGSTFWPTNAANLGVDNNNIPVYHLSGSMAITRIYNRALSSTEVLQNCNATKARFNL